MPIINLVYEAPEGWKPGANTIFYLPFSSDTLDHSGNGVATSGGGTVTYQNPGASLTGEFTITQSSNPSSFTLCGYMKTISTSTMCMAIYQLTFTGGRKGYDIYMNEGGNDNFRLELLKPNSAALAQRFGSIGVTSWHHYCFTMDNNTTVYVYVDGVLKGSYNTNGFTPYPGNMVLAASSTLYVSELIYENKVWTADEVSEYYNGTKGNYLL